ncbi:MAG: PEGA domain-containing protein [Candidatus Sericytochromatia bacterium]
MKRALLTALSFCLVWNASLLPALAQTASATQAATPLPSLAILEPEFNGTEQALASAFAEKLRAQLFASGQVDIVERARIGDLVKEQRFQQHAVCGLDCLQDLGRMLGADYLVFSSVNRMGSLYAVTVRVISVQSGKTLAIVTEDCECSPAELLGKLTQAQAQDVLAQLRKLSPPQPVVAQTQAAPPILSTSTLVPTPLRVPEEPALNPPQAVSGGEFHQLLQSAAHNTPSRVQTAPAPAAPPPGRTPNTQSRGAIELLSQPAGAEVVIQGQYQGQTPLKLQLAEGAYVVTYRLKGHAERERRVVVLAHETQRDQVELTPASPQVPPRGPVPLHINTEPSGAEVYLDGQLLGLTPLQHQIDIKGHKLRLQKAGYETRSLYVGGDNNAEPVRISANLLPVSQDSWWMLAVLGGVVVTALGVSLIQRGGGVRLQRVEETPGYAGDYGFSGTY